MEFETAYALEMFFPRSAFVQVYLEAIANALDADATEIDISISTDGQMRPPRRLDITIADNGIGFSDERFDRFAKVKRPSDPHHKGLGRLVYLQYFSTVRVTSIFDTSKREFLFTKDFAGQSEIKPAEDGESSGTRLHFTGFSGERVKSYDDLKPGSLRDQIIEHFLPMLYDRKKRGVDFRITITLNTQTTNEQKDFFPDTQVITPKDIPTLQTKVLKDQSIDSFSEITMEYMVHSESGQGRHLIAVSIDGRTVPLTKLLPQTAIPLGTNVIFLFVSELFSGNSDSARQRLVLPDTVSESELYRLFRSEVSSVLSASVPEIEARNTSTKEHFEERYPHLTGYFEKDTVGLIDKDEAIQMAQVRFFKTQKEVLESVTMDDRLFEKSLEVSSRALTEYVLYRELIIKKLREITSDDVESVVHDLIVPRGKAFTGNALIDDLYSNNAWILDDKFMSFRTILSEARMSQVIDAITLDAEGIEDDGRPDISMIFSADPDKSEKVEVVVVEVKRRELNDKESTYAPTQLLKRARKLVDHCPSIQRAWYFAVIEIDAALDTLLRDDEWTPLYSKGHVYYRDRRLERPDGVSVPVPLCLLSFDAVIEDAAIRNHTFLEILRSDMKKVKSA
ncbi:MAG: sensor histidine kinase [Verrucomicrobia bacterium]|nr:sensor histidine kinase [Verrucomicrobiota bacterium]